MLTTLLDLFSPKVQNISAQLLFRGKKLIDFFPKMDHFAFNFFLWTRKLQF